MTSSRRSRVPEVKAITDEPEHYAFLDTLDKRQQRVAELNDLNLTATNAEIAAAINAILQAHRTK